MAAVRQWSPRITQRGARGLHRRKLAAPRVAGRELAIEWLLKRGEASRGTDGEQKEQSVEGSRPHGHGPRFYHQTDMIPLALWSRASGPGRVTRCAALSLLLVASSSCRASDPMTAPMRVVERVGVAMGSELRLSAWTCGRSGSACRFRRGVRGVRAARGADEHVASGQRRRPHQRRRRRSQPVPVGRRRARRAAHARGRSASGPRASSTSRSAR